MYLSLIALALSLFFLLAFTRPRHAIVLLAGLLPAYLLRFTIGGIPTNFFEAAVWLAFLACLFRSPGLRITCLSGRQADYGLRFLSTPYPLLTTAFIIAATLSAFLTPTLHSFGILKSWILTPIVFAFLVPSLAKGRGGGGIFSSLIISGTIVALFGLFQLGTLDRITSIYDVPNSLALFIAPLIILALFRGGCLNHLAALIMFVALLGTQSLAGLASVLTTLFLTRLIPGLRITCLSSRQADYGLHPPSLPVTRYSLLFLLLFSLVFLTFTGRLSYFLQPLYNSSVQTSLAVRQQLWSISLELIKEHPIRGIGLGQFEPAYQQKLHEHFRDYGLPACPAGRRITDYEPLHEFLFRDPHNWLLSFWLNTGFLGLLSFTTLNLLALKPLFLSSRITDYLPVRQVGGLPACPADRRITALALLTLLIFGFLDTIYWKNDLAALHWLLLGLLLRFM